MKKCKIEIPKTTKEITQVIYKELSIRSTAYFSADTMQDCREWGDTFKVLKEKNCQPRILYAAKLSFRDEEEMKSLKDKKKQGIHHWPITSKRMFMEILY